MVELRKTFTQPQHAPVFLIGTGHAYCDADSDNMLRPISPTAGESITQITHKREVWSVLTLLCVGEQLLFQKKCCNQPQVEKAAGSACGCDSGTWKAGQTVTHYNFESACDPMSQTNIGMQNSNQVMNAAVDECCPLTLICCMICYGFAGYFLFLA